MASSSSSSGWAWLPKELLDLILDKLILLPDYIRFGAVCKPWLSVALDKKQIRTRTTCFNHPPMLLIPTSQECSGSLYSITEQKIYNCGLHVPYSTRCCGSSHGWLARAEDNLAITLINPFSGKTIHLPPVMEVPRAIIDEDYTPPEEYAEEYYNTELIFVPEFHIRRVILSSDPSLNPDDYVVVAIYSTCLKLAIIKPGDQSWTYIDDTFRPVKDVIFYKGQLYGLEGYNAFVTIDITSSSSSDSDDGDDNSDAGSDFYDGPEVEIVVQPCLKFSHKPYLVESSSGDLLLVRRLHLKEKDGDNEFGDTEFVTNFEVTVKFKVYKLMIHSSGGKQGEWVEIESLGGDALFLGDNQSVSVLASNFPNCRPSSIYYTDDCTERCHNLPYEARDMGVFNLEDGSFEKHYSLLPSQKYAPPTVWIVPTLQ